MLAIFKMMPAFDIYVNINRLVERRCVYELGLVSIVKIHFY